MIRTRSEVERILDRASEAVKGARAEEAYELTNEALRRALRHRSVSELLLALSVSARVLWQSQELEAAEDVAQLGCDIATRTDTHDHTARLLNLLGILRHMAEDWAGARDHYLRALEVARGGGEDRLVAAICQNLGVVANSLGDLREARALYLEGISACVRARISNTAGIAYNNLAMVCADLEEWTEAEIFFLRGVEIAERVGDTSLLARLLTGRAEPLIRTGEMDAARKSLDRAEELARTCDDTRAVADVERYRGMMSRAEGAFEAAEAHLDRALGLATEGGMELERAETLEEMARLRAAAGRMGAARVVLKEARRAYERLGAARDLLRLDEMQREWAPSPAAAPSRS